LYKSLSFIIDWTSNYITNKKVLDLQKEIKLAIFALKPTSKPSEYQEIIDKFRKVFALISKDHERHEILPKKILEEESEEDRFYRDQETKPLQYAAKAFTDLILKKK
jgi:hypothetical protein